MHVVDEIPLIYENEIDIDERLKKVGDGSLSFEIIDPHKKHRVIFNGPKHKLDLVYEPRFGIVDFHEGEERIESGHKGLDIEHYEQAMNVSGSVTMDGKTRCISCFGHRDHSWGFRNEDLIQGWNWIAIQCPDRTINFVIAKITEDFSGSRGRISDGSGSTKILDVQKVSTDRDAKSLPVGSTYRLEASDGRTWTISSKMFSQISLPMKEKKGGVVHENFSHFSIEESGETGVGIDEYMEKADSAK
jgi:hypothetical protein